MTVFQGRALRMGAAAAVFAVMATPGMAQDAGPVSDIPGDLLVDLQNSYIFIFNDKKVRTVDVPGRAQGLANRHGGVVEHVYSNAVRGFSARMSATAAAQMAARNRDIAYYEADRLVWAVGERRRPNTVRPNNRGQSNRVGSMPVDGMPRATGKPGIDNTGPEVTPSGILRVGGPATKATMDSISATVWVLDTGIDLDHPDLIVDIGRSRKFAGGRDARDRNGHGTHVAGTIGALKNEIDVVGVAPGATLVSVRVLRKNGGGRTSGVIAGVDYVAANALPGDVANMSVATIGGPSQALDDAVVRAADAGILFAVAAGNDDPDRDANNVSPARVEHPNVYTVSAVNGNDVFASFSNMGNPPIDFAAPGVNVLSSAIDGGTAWYSGTSMATPHVAGVLLVTGGWPGSKGCARDDPDGDADPIVHIGGSASC